MEEETEAHGTYDSYSMLAVGNYWVYERYQVDSMGNATPMGIIDSFYIEKDTVINSQVYYKMRYPHQIYTNTISTSFLKDSLHYIVSLNGGICFSSQDFTTVFDTTYVPGFGNPADTMAIIEEKMGDQDYIKSTPAGNFITSSMQHVFYMQPPWSSQYNDRILNTRYAKNVGMVSQMLNFYLGQSYDVERRLVSYHIN